jgi:X-X-X-Leu-X-X-Gly heptad repeat protein
VGDILTTVLASNIGGTVDMVLKVGAVSEIVVATAIDLTKSVNKLTDGAYTLANGTEGQIMYLVRQTGSDGASITVRVASARVDGAEYSDHIHTPFGGGGDSLTTMIFTDGAWQSTNPYWL